MGMLLRARTACSDPLCEGLLARLSIPTAQEFKATVWMTPSLCSMTLTNQAQSQETDAPQGRRPLPNLRQLQGNEGAAVPAPQGLPGSWQVLATAQVLPLPPAPTGVSYVAVVPMPPPRSIGGLLL